MITAAKTGKVKERPLFGWTVWMKEKSRMPAIAASIAAQHEGEDLVA